MAIDREAVKASLNEQKAKRTAAGIRFLPKDKTTNLRIVEFTDKEGKQQFSREVVYYRINNKDTILDRLATLGAPCAATRLVEMATENNEDSPFLRHQTVHLINAVDISKKPFKMEIWQIPVTVWEQLCEHLITDDWEDVLELEGGHPFAVTRSGSGLDTEYSAVPARKSWDVPEDLHGDIIDPFDKLEDPGLEGQCQTLKVNIEDLFSDPDELDDVEPLTGTNATEKKSTKKGGGGGKKQSKKTSKKTAKKSGFSKGDRVEGEIDGEWYPGKITKVSGDDEYAVTFDDGDKETLGGAMIRPLEEEPEEAEEEEEEEETGPAEGDEGMGLYEDGEWYKGTIKKVNKNGSIRVEFEDGDTATLDPESQWKAGDASDDIPFDDVPVPGKGGSTAKNAAKALT